MLASSPPVISTSGPMPTMSHLTSSGLANIAGNSSSRWFKVWSQSTPQKTSCTSRRDHKTLLPATITVIIILASQHKNPNQIVSV